MTDTSEIVLKGSKRYLRWMVEHVEQIEVHGVGIEMGRWSAITGERNYRVAFRVKQLVEDDHRTGRAADPVAALWDSPTSPRTGVETCGPPDPRGPSAAGGSRSMPGTVRVSREPG